LGAKNKVKKGQKIGEKCKKVRSKMKNSWTKMGDQKSVKT
jgi:hypothetical protein